MAQINRHKEKKGFALLLAIIVASVVLSIGISILNISVNQLSLSSTARESELAFQSSQAIMDCMQYWRYERASQFIAEQAGGVGTIFTPTSVDCFGSLSIESEGEVILSTGTSHINQYSYRFEWGTPRRCTETQMVVMNATDEEIEYTFPGSSVGDDGDGLKTCDFGNVCTLLFTQGYNRECEELTTSIFTVQRELTLEF